MLVLFRVFWRSLVLLVSHVILCIFLTLIKQLTQTSTGKKPAEKILGDEWTLEKRIPDLASELIAYNEHQD